MIELLKQEELARFEAIHEEIYSEPFPHALYEKKVTKSKIVNYLILNNQVVVGYVIVDFKATKDLYIWLGGILPKFQRNGYFAQMFDALMKIARNEQFKQLTVATYNHYPNMIKLAINKGFKITGTTDGAYGDGVKILFAKPVSPHNELRIGLTNTCNFKCFFCHNEGMNSARAVTLSTEKLTKILVQAKENDIEKITFTGGEPTINRKAIEAALLYLNDINYLPHITIVTNGSLMDEAFIALLKEYNGELNMNLSFHSVEKLSFDQLTQTGRYFERVCACMDLFNEHNISFRLNYVVLKGVNDQLAQIERLVKECQARNIQKVTFLELLISKENPEMMPYYVSYAQIKAVLQTALPQLQQEFETERKTRLSYTDGDYTLFLEILKLSCTLGCANCTAVKDRMIGPDGEYYPCFVQQAFSCGNVSENMAAAFEDGNRIIAQYAKKYGANSPLLI